MRYYVKPHPITGTWSNDNISIKCDIKITVMLQKAEVIYKTVIKQGKGILIVMGIGIRKKLGH